MELWRAAQSGFMVSNLHQFARKHGDMQAVIVLLPVGVEAQRLVVAAAAAAVACDVFVVALVMVLVL